MPEFGQFPSLPVSLLPGSRLVSLWGGRRGRLGAKSSLFGGSLEINPPRWKFQNLVDHQHNSWRGQEHGFRESCRHGWHTGSDKTLCWWTAICDALFWRTSSVWEIKLGRVNACAASGSQMFTLWKQFFSARWPRRIPFIRDILLLTSFLMRYSSKLWFRSRRQWSTTSGGVCECAPLG